MYSVQNPQIYFLFVSYNQFISLYIMSTIGIIICESPISWVICLKENFPHCNIKYA